MKRLRQRLTGDYHSQRIILILAILAVFGGVAAGVGVYIHHHQEKQLTRALTERTRLEAELIGAFLSDSMLRGDYAEAQELLANWPRSHQDVVRLVVTVGSGRTFFDYRVPDKEGSCYVVTEKLRYGRRALTLALGHDTTELTRTLNRLSNDLTLLSLAVVGLMGVALWYVLFYWMVRPMEQQIAARTRALQDHVDYTDSLLHSIHSHLAVLDENGTIIQTNRAWQEFARDSGYAGDPTMVGESYFRTGNAGEAPCCCDGSDAETREKGVVAVLRQEVDQFVNNGAFISEDGKFWFAMRAVPVAWSGPRRVIVTHEDVTAIKRAEEALRESREELRHINRVYEALSECNFAVSTARDEVTLLREVAGIVHTVCGYRLVWIGYAREDADKTIEPMVYQGQDQGYITHLDASWGRHDRSQGPVGACIRDNRPVIIFDTAVDQRYPSWREQALAKGFLSAAAFPLCHDNQTLGAITVYAETVGAFSTKEVALLTELSKNLAFGILALRDRQAREETQRQLEILSITDKLTQLYNRIKTDEVLEAELKRVERFQMPLSMVLLDIDHFKQVNDTYGHQAGDRALVRVADILREGVRRVDVVGRWGGEEFLIICPQTDSDGACNLAEKLRLAIEASACSEVGVITASFGVVSFQGNDSAETLLARADTALYKAKENGRNRVVMG